MYRTPHGLHGLTVLVNRMAAQHLPQDLVLSNSGQQKLAPTTMKFD